MAGFDGVPRRDGDARRRSGVGGRNRVFPAGRTGGGAVLSGGVASLPGVGEGRRFVRPRASRRASARPAARPTPWVGPCSRARALAVVPPPHRGCLGVPEGAPRKTASEQRVDHAVDADEGEQSPDLAGLGAEPDRDLQSLVAGRDLYRLAHADVRWSKPPSVAAEARSFGSSNASPRGIAAMKSLASAADRARFTSLSIPSRRFDPRRTPSA
jgi:hypothetical protein